MEIQSIPCVFLPVTDVNRSVDWWVNHFGLRFGSSYQPDSGYAELRVGNGQWIFLYETNRVSDNYRFTRGVVPNSDNEEIFVFTLVANDVVSLYHKLKESGVRVGRLDERGGGHAFDCYDPDGHKLNIWGGEWKEDE